MKLLKIRRWHEVLMRLPNELSGVSVTVDPEAPRGSFKQVNFRTHFVFAIASDADFVKFNLEI